jgi:hypothetical protein
MNPQSLDLSVEQNLTVVSFWKRHAVALEIGTFDACSSATEDFNIVVRRRVNAVEFKNG